MLIELIGFVISLLALIYLAGRQVVVKKPTPEENEEILRMHQRHALEEIFGSRDESQDFDERLTIEEAAPKVVVKRQSLRDHYLQTELREKPPAKYTEKKRVESTAAYFLSNPDDEKSVWDVIESDPYALKEEGEDKKSAAISFHKRGYSLRDAVILQEILKHHKSLAGSDELW